jgi:transcriptional regulator with XRE-family HTH domain
MSASLIQYDPAKLKRKRAEAGLTQEGLAFKSGVTQTHISRLERAAVPGTSVKSLAKLARGLKCKPADLMPADESREAAAA